MCDLISMLMMGSLFFDWFRRLSMSMMSIAGSSPC